MILRPVGIACFGTSLTTGRLSGGWVQKLQDKLNGVSRRRVICYDVGQGSQTSVWGVANIDRPRNHRPDICLIEFSINDSVTANGISISQATANLTSIVNTLRAVNPAVLIYLMTMNGIPDLALRPNLEAYYQNDRDFAAANGCGLIDIRPVWGAPNYTDTPDGLHPTEAAVTAKLLPTVFGVLAPIVAAVPLPTTPPAQPPILATVSPASGPLAGGTTITLSGSNLTGATSVTIGGVAATSVNVVNASTVTCVTPAGGAGAKDVVITTPAGSSTVIGGFTHGVVVRSFNISPAVGGKTTWNLDTDGPLNLSTQGTWTITPLFSFTTSVKAWGEGGGPGGGGFGAGAFSGGDVALPAGVSITLGVGQGRGPAPQYGPSGGGWTGLFFTSSSLAILIAGGGGGGGYSSSSVSGGPGGWPDGFSGAADPNGGDGGGGGATQSGPGPRGNAGGNLYATNGSPGSGRNGGAGGYAGGGGGGGYFGGGGGAGSDFSGAAGGGGSSYFDPAVVANPQMLSGSGTTPGNASDPARSGAGSSLSGRLILA